MLRVGLTGSIAVGKSFVAGWLAELGCAVLDADQTARRVVEPGEEGLESVVAAFGDGVLAPGGQLDRAKLGAVVFADEAKRHLLNSILHPLIIAAQDDWMRQCERDDPRGIAVVDAALMIETGGYKRFDKIVVVHCHPDIQLARLMKRQSLSPEEARARIAAQLPQEEKMRHANYLIDTSSDFDETRRRVEGVYRKLREMADGTR